MTVKITKGKITIIREVFIYMLIDPRNDNIKYVGKSDDIIRRLGQHVNESERATKPTRKNTWIKELLDLNLYPQMEVIEKIPQREWKSREQYWIAFLRENGIELTNMTDGGEGFDITSPKIKRELILKSLRTRIDKKAKQYELGKATSRWVGVTKDPKSTFYRVSYKGFHTTYNEFFRYETEAALYYNKLVLQRYGKYAVLNFVTLEDIENEKNNRMEEILKDYEKIKDDYRIVQEGIITISEYEKQKTIERKEKSESKKQEKIREKIEKAKLKEELKLENNSND